MPASPALRVPPLQPRVVAFGGQDIVPSPARWVGTEGGYAVSPWLERAAIDKAQRCFLANHYPPPMHLSPLHCSGYAAALPLLEHGQRPLW